MEREKHSLSKNYRDIREKHSPSKNYRDIGEVVTPLEKMNAARELSSCCLGTEALLASNKNFDSYIRRNRSRTKPGKVI